LACFDAYVSVYFPTTDIPVLLQQRQAFNNAAMLPSACEDDAEVSPAN